MLDDHFELETAKHGVVKWTFTTLLKTPANPHPTVYVHGYAAAHDNDDIVWNTKVSRQGSNLVYTRDEAVHQEYIAYWVLLIGAKILYANCSGFTHLPARCPVLCASSHRLPST